LFGQSVPDEVYRDILATARQALISAYHECFNESRIEAFVLPTTAIPARPIGDDETVELSGTRVPTLPIYLQNTDPSSVVAVGSVAQAADEVALDGPLARVTS
jgi:Asp-tRNA(Asn)/Glu-tRNA(Gln) amidotransferase A subunit family amidase